MQPIVSIIMPVLNGEFYIAEAIKSVLAQSYTHWELMVIDDGSTDNTAAIVQSFDDPRIHYVYQENRGQAGALNHGLDLANGDYITTLDADDAYPPNSLRDRVAWLETHPADGAVYGNGYYCNGDGEPMLSFAEYCGVPDVGDVYDRLIGSPFFGTGANVMQRRSVMTQYGLRYDETIVWCQDWDFYIRLAERTTFGYVDTFTVFYRIHATNMTTQMPEGRRLESLIRTKGKVLSAPRWQTVSPGWQADFFYSFLVDILHGRVEDQVQIVNSHQFCSLSKAQQSRLLRLMASKYLSAGVHHELVRQWMLRAWRLAPLAPKAALSAIASLFNTGLVRIAVSAWYRGHKKDEAMSPFRLALNPAVDQTTGTHDHAGP